VGLVGFEPTTHGFLRLQSVFIPLDGQIPDIEALEPAALPG